MGVQSTELHQAAVNITKTQLIYRMFQVLTIFRTASYNREGVFSIARTNFRNLYMFNPVDDVLVHFYSVPLIFQM